MSSSANFLGDRNNESARAARSGLYPNSHQPGGYRYDVPAVATAPTSLNHVNTTPVNSIPVWNTDGGSRSNQHIGISPSLGSSQNSATLAPRSNGTSNHINNSASMVIDRLSDPGGDDAMADVGGPGLVDESTDGTLTDLPDEDDAEEDKDAESVSTLEVATEPPSTKPTKLAARRKRKLVDNPTKATCEKAIPCKAITRKAQVLEKEALGNEILEVEEQVIEAPKAKGSGEVLKPNRFATKAYKESQSLVPPIRLFKPTEPTNDLPTSASLTETSFEREEIQHLLRSLPGDTSVFGAKYFITLGDSTSLDKLDKQIAVGFKRSQGNDNEDDESGERPQRSKARGKKEQLFVFNGLNTSLKPMSNIDDIFVDLTENALKNGFSEFLNAIGSAKLKVSTLCSGTESPLLALQMIQDSEYNLLPCKFIADSLQA
jgi:hypothetical protein